MVICFGREAKIFIKTLVEKGIIEKRKVKEDGWEERQRKGEREKARGTRCDERWSKKVLKKTEEDERKKKR